MKKDELETKSIQRSTGKTRSYEATRLHLAQQTAAPSHRQGLAIVQSDPLHFAARRVVRFHSTRTDHVGREKRGAVLGEVFLVLKQHAVEPRKQFLRAVIAMQDNRDAVERCKALNVVGAADCAGDGGLLVLVPHALSGVEDGAALAELDHDRGVRVARGLETRVDGRAARAVDGRNGEALLLGILEQLGEVIAVDDTRLDNVEDAHCGSGGRRGGGCRGYGWGCVAGGGRCTVRDVRDVELTQVWLRVLLVVEGSFPIDESLGTTDEVGLLGVGMHEGHTQFEVVDGC